MRIRRLGAARVYPPRTTLQTQLTRMLVPSWREQASGQEAALIVANTTSPQVSFLCSMIEATDDLSEKRRYLVFHDLGMSGMWWWIRARSADEIVLTYANVEVVEDPKWQEHASTWSVDDVDIDESGEEGELLSSLRQKRDRQRTQPGFGALAGRDRVYLKRPTDVGTSLTEHGPDGRRLRQVDVGPGGKVSRVDHFVLNPPYDLYDPELSPWEISAEEFEEAWGNAWDQSAS